MRGVRIINEPGDGGTSTGRLGRRAMGGLLAAVTTASTVVVLAQPASAEPIKPWQPRKERSVPGRQVHAKAALANPAAAHAVRGPRRVVWPKPATSDVTLDAAAGSGGVRAGGQPVRVALPKTGAKAATANSPRKVRIETLDHAKATKARAAGLLLRASRADGTATAGDVSVQVDYSGFRNAYGADWADRLHLVRLPDCALTSPDKPDCQPTPLASHNATKAGTLTATVPLPATRGVLIAATAAPSGGSGDYTATSLAASAAWNAGGPSGDFNWSYPLRVPPSPAGAAPKLALSYSSQAVDGMTAASNNQPSWIGQGFDFWPGYIERRYKSCSDDSDASTPKTADECWGTDNATVSLNGKATELVLDDATKTWHLREDDGSRVERFFDTSKNNGDSDGEYWRITSTDGTQYYFGLNRLPGWSSGNTETASTWTVPVAGNNSGEPCHQSSFDASFALRRGGGIWTMWWTPTPIPPPTTTSRRPTGTASTRAQSGSATSAAARWTTSTTGRARAGSTPPAPPLG